MRLSFLRFVVAVFAVIVLVPSNAQAIVRTIDFTASRLAITLGDPFGLLGVDSQPTVSGSFSFDTNASPFFGPFTVDEGDPQREFTDAVSPYLSFSVNVGGVTFNGVTSNVGDDRITIRDGTGTGVNHAFGVQSSTNQALPTGGTLDSFSLVVFSTLIENPYDTTAIPSLAALNSMNFSQDFRFNILSLTGQTPIDNFAGYTRVSFSENLNVVPLPTALPLFGSGLALMGFIGWCRKRKVAAAA